MRVVNLTCRSVAREEEGASRTKCRSLESYRSGAQKACSQNENIRNFDMHFGAGCTKPVLPSCTTKPFAGTGQPGRQPCHLPPRHQPAWPQGPRPSCALHQCWSHRSAAFLASFSLGATSSRATRTWCLTGRCLFPALPPRDVQFPGTISRGLLSHAVALLQNAPSLWPCHKPSPAFLLWKRLRAKN